MVSYQTNRFLRIGQPPPPGWHQHGPSGAGRDGGQRQRDPLPPLSPSTPLAPSPPSCPRGQSAGVRRGAAAAGAPAHPAGPPASADWRSGPAAAGPGSRGCGGPAGARDRMGLPPFRAASITGLPLSRSATPTRMGLSLLRSSSFGSLPRLAMDSGSTGLLDWRHNQPLCWRCDVSRGRAEK